MSIFINGPSLASTLARAEVAPYWQALRRRNAYATAEPTLVQSGDTQAWWHLVWERISDAAFVQAAEPSDRMASWVRDRVLETIRRPLDDWIGPWFRPRTDPPQGQLETAHVALAVATAIDLCPDLLSPGELDETAMALRSKAQAPCRAWIERRLDERRVNNWLMVLLNGYAAASAVLDDGAAISFAAEQYGACAALYNSDSYGESLQYWNYATLHLAHLNELLRRWDPQARPHDTDCYTRCIPWAVSSLVGMKPLEGWDPRAVPRSVNFGDSAAVFRPTADVLLHIAARARESHPREAGLARWLFETCYADPDLGPWERATFGFFNQCQFLGLLLLPEAAGPMAPEQAGLSPAAAFDAGPVVVRDRWREPEVVLEIHGGTASLAVSSHRHADLASFQLTCRGERLFVDPGHCCYRLQTQAWSKTTTAHSTWRFFRGDDPLEQRIASGSVHQPEEPLARVLQLSRADDATVVVCDAARAYGAPITRAERTWLLVGCHALFVVDRVESAEPVRLESRFVLNNRDNRLRVNEASFDRLVLRRGAAAVKFFTLGAWTPGGTPVALSLGREWGAVHDAYHPQPNQPGQGREGGAVIYHYTSGEARPALIVVYALAMAPEAEIRGWHIRRLEDRRFGIEPPGGAGGVVLDVAEGGDLRLEAGERRWSVTATEMRPL